MITIYLREVRLASQQNEKLLVIYVYKYFLTVIFMNVNVTSKYEQKKHKHE